MVSLLLIFWGTSTLLLQWLFSFTLPHMMRESSLFFSFLPAPVTLSLFDNSHYYWDDMISHCTFYWHFPDDYWGFFVCLFFSGYLLAIFMSSFEKYMKYFLTQVCVLLSFYRFLMYFRNQLFVRYMVHKYFLPFSSWPLYSNPWFLCVCVCGDVDLSLT